MKPSSTTEQEKYILTSSIFKWSKSVQDPNLQRYLRIALKLYVLEALGFKTRDMKPNEFANFCGKLTVQKMMKQLEKFVEKNSNSSQEENSETSLPSPKENLKACILNAFDQQFEVAVGLGLVKQSTKHNYRSAVGRFGEYLPQQTWWKEVFPPQMPEFIPQCPKPVKKETRPQGENYRLLLEEFSPHLVKQLEEYKEFRLTGGKKVKMEDSWKNRELSIKPFQRPKMMKTNETNVKRELNDISRFLGWYVRISGHHNKKIELELIMNIEILHEYIIWLTEERRCFHSSGLQILKVAIAVTKFFNYNTSKRRNWSDIDLIMKLQSFQSCCREEYIKEKKESLESKWEKKELTHPEARKILQYLRDCCAENSSKASHIPGKRIKGKKRSTSAIVWSWQVYLIVKTFVFLPVRQQEVRQLKFGETLFRKIDKKGHPYYETKITEHKNKSKTGKTRKYKLSGILVTELDAWINIWRPKAVEAVQTLENWLKFANYEIRDVERLQQCIEMAKQGYTHRNVKNIQKYIERLETELLGLKNRIEAWPSAKANLEDNSLFFMIGKKYPQSFGKPLSTREVHSLVTISVSKATTALFGEPRWTNPHAFRHIAAKHVRKNNGDTKKLAGLMGHSEAQGDEYANGT